MPDPAALRRPSPALPVAAPARQVPSAGPVRLSPRQKAAVVIHLLVNGGADPGLRELPPDQQRRLVHEMAALRFIDRETLSDIVAEFASELDNIGLHFPRDAGKVLASLDGCLSIEVVEALTSELGDSVDPGEGPWRSLAGLPETEIARLMEGESDEVCAILLSKLPPARAATLIGGLSPERGHAIAAAFARTEGVTPRAVSRIGLVLARQTASRAVPAFETDAVRRVGGILNSATSGVRRAILESLEASDATFAGRVRAAVFSYENIPDRLVARDVPRVLREVDGDVLVAALAGTPPELAAVRDFLLGSLSTRMADQLRDQIAELPEPPRAEAADAAMAAVVTAIRDLEESGEIALTTPDT